MNRCCNFYNNARLGWLNVSGDYEESGVYHLLHMCHIELECVSVPLSPLTSVSLGSGSYRLLTWSKLSPAGYTWQRYKPVCHWDRCLNVSGDYEESGVYHLLHMCHIQVSQEECARLREGVPYVKVYRYNPKHLCPKLNGYGDNGHRKVWSSGGSTHCTSQLTTLSMSVLECGVILRQFSSRSKLLMYFLLGDKVVHVSAWHSCHL